MRVGTYTNVTKKGKEIILMMDFESQSGKNLSFTDKMYYNINNISIFCFYILFICFCAFALHIHRRDNYFKYFQCLVSGPVKAFRNLDFSSNIFVWENNIFWFYNSNKICESILNLKPFDNKITALIPNELKRVGSGWWIFSMKWCCAFHNYQQSALFWSELLHTFTMYVITIHTFIQLTFVQSEFATRICVYQRIFSTWNAEHVYVWKVGDASASIWNEMKKKKLLTSTVKIFWNLQLGATRGKE